MIFKAVGESRPYPDHSFTSQREWGTIAPTQVRLDRLITTQRMLDLSTLFAKSHGSPNPPAQLAYDKLHPDVNQHRIHAAWYKDEVLDVCLRAWLSAVYVLFLRSVRVLFLPVTDSRLL